MDVHVHVACSYMYTHGASKLRNWIVMLFSFCELQEQVDAGVPLPTCLRLFRQWVGSVSQRWSMLLMEPGHQYSEELNLCALATWSGKPKVFAV